ncbi:MAG: ribonuclease HII [Elusimicrobiota bacterium]|jgi:ribonuclease HII|nr:ribonuclease HII [Elusimicrobiota bacterium]
MNPYFLFDKKYADLGYDFIAGVDEAGRGPLAGPVTAAAVILPALADIDGVKDSKQISFQKRKELSEKIKKTALSFSIVSIDNETIDKINILQATILAMKKALLSLKLKPSICLIDGNQKIKEIQMHQESITGGDGKSLSIAAASILAKVKRDEIMIEYAKLYPNYNFEKHKGYGVKTHIEAVKKFGVCPIHRLTFKPIAELALKTAR